MTEKWKYAFSAFAVGVLTGFVDIPFVPIL